jgi:hypothetical protein
MLAKFKRRRHTLSTAITFPMRSVAFSAVMAASASAAVSIVTNPNPRDSRVCGSYMTEAFLTYFQQFSTSTPQNTLQHHVHGQHGRTLPQGDEYQPGGSSLKHEDCFQGCDRHQRHRDPRDYEYFFSVTSNDALSPLTLCHPWGDSCCGWSAVEARLHGLCQASEHC